MQLTEVPVTDQDPADSIWNVRERLQENFRRVEALLAEMETQKDLKMRLAAAGEMRQHIALAEKTLETAARAEAVRVFEEIVLTMLTEAGAQVRKAVMDALKARDVDGDDCDSPEIIPQQDGSAILE